MTDIHRCTLCNLRFSDYEEPDVVFVHPECGDDADPRRIAAALLACRGIPTEDLEKHTVVVDEVDECEG